MAGSRKPVKRSRSTRSKRGGRPAKSKSKSRRATRSKSQKRATRAKSRKSPQGRKSKSRVKVSPSTYNKKKCAVTPGWEWVQGKGCRKVKKGKKKSGKGEEGGDSDDASGSEEEETEGSDEESATHKPKKSRKSKDGKSPSTYNKKKCQATPGWQWVQGVGCRKVRDYNKKKEAEGDASAPAGTADSKISPSTFNEALCKATAGWQWVPGVGCRKIRNYKMGDAGLPSTTSTALPSSSGNGSGGTEALEETAKMLQSIMPTIQKINTAAAKAKANAAMASCPDGVCPVE